MDKLNLEELYNKYSDELCNYLFRLSHSRDTAFDLTQETFVHISKTLAKGQVIKKEKGYIFTTAYHLFCDLKRAKKDKTDIDIESIMTLSNGNSATEKMQWRILEEEIICKLEEEDEILANYFILRVEYGMSQKEIAKIAKKPYSTVRRYFEKIQSILLYNFREELKLSGDKKN